MQLMCNRCSEWAHCGLNYNGEACKRVRAERCPDVVYTNEDWIREMDTKELAGFLHDFMNVCWACPMDYECENGSAQSCFELLLKWLRQPMEKNKA